MKHLLLTTIAAMVMVGCGESQKQVPSVKKSNPEADRALLKAAEEGNIEAVKQHLAAGTDVNAKGFGGWTPLHFAAFKGHKEIVELLIAKGANVNAQLDDGRTPLDVAIRLKRTEVADLLRKHGGKTREELKAEGK